MAILRQARDRGAAAATLKWAAVLAAAAWALSGCKAELVHQSYDGAFDQNGTGGTIGSGGRLGSGGGDGTGGVVGTGGVTGSGGGTSSGGATGSGGTGSGGMTGPGGTTSTGGTTGTGGAITGVGGRASGGATGTGGSGSGGVTPGTGGSAGRGSGGMIGSGGIIGSGGMTGSGGVIGSGGMIGSGGVIGSGGMTGAGGNGAKPSAGCGTAPTLTNGTVPLQSGGKARSYIITLPVNYDRNHPYRLVLAYHWNGGTSNDVATGSIVAATGFSFYGLAPIANDSAIFVAPQGTGNGWANSAGDDLVFADDMIAQIGAGLCVDKARIFAMGYSFGGGMTYALACARADVFRAVAIMGGAVLSGCVDGTKPIAYFQSHGYSDPIVGLNSAKPLRDKFAGNDGCAAGQTPADSGVMGSKSHVCTKYQGCSAGHPVEWCLFDGGALQAPADGATTENAATTWLPGEIWKFFTQF